MATDAKDAPGNSFWTLLRRRFLSDAPGQVLDLQSSLAQNRHTGCFAKQLRAYPTGYRGGGRAPQDSSEKRDHISLRLVTVRPDSFPQIQLELTAGRPDLDYMNRK